MVNTGFAAFPAVGRRDSLLFGETSEVPPVAWEVFKLVGVDGDEHQHGVGHHQPPEELQQTPPQGVVHLGQHTTSAGDTHQSTVTLYYDRRATW